MSGSASSIKLRKLSPFLFIPLWFAIGASCQAVVTYSSKSSEELLCPLTDQTFTASWTDETAGDILSTYQREKPDIDIVPSGSKHINFMYNVSASSFSIFIRDVEAEDGGEYVCITVGGGGSRTEHTVVVEVLAKPTVMNGSQDVDALDVIVGTSYDLTCSATGARSVNNLSLMWDPLLVEKTPLSVTTNGDYKNYSITSTYTAVRDISSVTCQLTGYVMQDEIDDQRMEIISHTVNLNVRTNTFTTERPSTTDPQSTVCNNTRLMTVYIVEAIIIMVLILVIIYFIARDRLGHGKKLEPRSTNQIEELKGTENRANMDLQEFKVNKNKNLEVPEKNVQLVSLLPGKGMLQYHKALVMRAAGNLEAVVRTLSGDSSLKMNKVQSSEIQYILNLPSDNSIVKLLGWCDTVPNYLICERVSGRNLSDHLTEEFSPQKVHMYGNTKQKRFNVAEKGNAEHLPKYALQVARGLQFLTKHRFVSPGLRSKKILLDAAGRCKLYDFVSMENAKEWTKLFWNENVPFQWMPPEFLFLETISSAGDVWSFGVLLWEIFSYGLEPYKGQNQSDVEKSLRAKRQLPLPDNCPGAIWQVMITCWEPTVEERLNIDDVTYKLAAICHEDREYQEIR
ncbi:uncharacterized protein [Apostichopus japonicus]|uniref:uncharacterized protein n=1 Tax=Stichopus japonicus TaxID=307972 RepID=UPI003AB4059C